METTYYPASERGHVNFGWLDSHHSFSFGNWHNREKVHFGALRVLNDDTIKGGKGFDTHPHENMEIVTIPLKGALAHKDSTGSEGIIYTGDVQIMSAGSGIRNSEYNASPDGPEGRRPKVRQNANQEGVAYSTRIRPLDPYDPVNLLQIWIFPKHTGVAPRHDQQNFDPAARQDRWQFVVSPCPEDQALKVYQDARLALARLSAGVTLTYQTAFPGNGIYIFVLEGQLQAGSRSLQRRDGFGITGTDTYTFEATSSAELLAIEVPMFA